MRFRGRFHVGRFNPARSLVEVGILRLRLVFVPERKDQSSLRMTKEKKLLRPTRRPSLHGIALHKIKGATLWLNPR
jgi:hypothetical protein